MRGIIMRAACALHVHCICTGSYAVHHHIHCITLQDFARNDFELRQFIVGGKVEHRVYSHPLTLTLNPNPNPNPSPSPSPNPNPNVNPNQVATLCAQPSFAGMDRRELQKLSYFFTTTTRPARSAIVV